MLEELGSIALSTLKVMRYVLPSIFLGLFLSSFLSVRSFFAVRGAKFIDLLSRLTGLHPASVGAVLLSIGDRTAGFASLSMAKEREHLPDAQIVAACLTLKAPAGMQALFLTFLPIMGALFPALIAFKFLAMYYSIFIFVSAIGLWMARRQANKAKNLKSQTTGEEVLKVTVPSMGESLSLAFKRTIKAFLRIAAWLLGMSFLAGLLAKTGILNGLAGFLPIPAEHVVYAAAGLISITGGIGATGMAFKDGLLTKAELMPLLFSTALLHNSYDYFASLLPLSVSIFGHRLGVKVASALALTTIGGIAAVMAIVISVSYR
jgi:hypothetical protein